MSPEESRWVPRLIHLRSKVSDGRNTIEQLRRLARARRCRSLIVTDHADTVPRERCQENVRKCHDRGEAHFLTVRGLERGTGWALPNRQDDSTAHTPALDITDALDLRNGPGADYGYDMAAVAGSSAKAITLGVTFPWRTTRPMFAYVYRDGVEVSGFTDTYGRGIERLVLNWDLPTLEASQHAYTGAVAGTLVTSPIVFASP
jgi:hypothetical protein